MKDCDLGCHLNCVIVSSNLSSGSRLHAIEKIQLTTKSLVSLC